MGSRKSVFGTYQNVMSDRWDYSELITNGGVCNATAASGISDIVAAARSWISVDLGHREESEMRCVFFDTFATSKRLGCDYSLTDFWDINQWGRGERKKDNS